MRFAGAAGRGHDRELGFHPADRVDEAAAVEVGHGHVGQQERDGLLVLREDGERLAAVAGQQHAVAVRFEDHARGLADRLLIVDDEDLLAASFGRNFGGGFVRDRRPRDASAGSRIWKVVPAPGLLCTRMRPPWLFTMPSVVERPRPVPWPMVFVVKNGSKMRSSNSGGMPAPVSAISELEIAAGREFRLHGGVMFVDDEIARGQREDSAARHGVARVHGEVQQHLVPLRRVAAEGGQVGREIERAVGCPWGRCPPRSPPLRG